jgi:hypothetical protein
VANGIAIGIDAPVADDASVADDAPATSLSELGLVALMLLPGAASTQAVISQGRPLSPRSWSRRSCW